MQILANIDIKQQPKIKYASFIQRTVAFILDFLLLLTVLLGIVGFNASKLVALVSNILEFFKNSLEFNSYLGLFLYFFGVPILGILYRSIFESSKLRGTPGKFILKLKLADKKGDRITFGRAVARNTAKILSALLLYIGYLIVLFTTEKQALHDTIAGTYVVNKN